jgi:flagellar hook-length control protein FliK
MTAINGGANAMATPAATPTSPTPSTHAADDGFAALLDASANDASPDNSIGANAKTAAPATMPPRPLPGSRAGYVAGTTGVPAESNATTEGSQTPVASSPAWSGLNRRAPVKSPLPEGSPHVTAPSRSADASATKQAGLATQAGARAQLPGAAPLVTIENPSGKTHGGNTSDIITKSEPGPSAASQQTPPGAATPVPKITGRLSAAASSVQAAAARTASGSPSRHSGLGTSPDPNAVPVAGTELVRVPATGNAATAAATDPATTAQIAINLNATDGVDAPQRAPTSSSTNDGAGSAAGVAIEPNSAGPTAATATIIGVDPASAVSLGSPPVAARDVAPHGFGALPATLDGTAPSAPSGTQAVPVQAPPPGFALPAQTQGAATAQSPGNVGTGAGPQVAMHVAQALHDGTSTVTVDLHPAELGRVQVQIGFHADGLNLRLTIDRPETFDALSLDRSGLEQQLAGAGVDLSGGGLDLRLGQQSGEWSNDSGQHGARLTTTPDVSPVQTTTGWIGDRLIDILA